MKALDDVWIIGDLFLKEIFSTLQDLKTQAIAKKKPPPYLYEYFNVTFSIANADMFKTNFLTQIQNAVIDAFNNREKIPKYIMFILDKDILESTNVFGFGVRNLLEKWINWLIKSLEKSLSTRVDNLRNLRPGAIPSWESKIIWLKMINHPEVGRDDQRFKILSLRNKLNVIYEQIAESKKQHHYMDVCALEPVRHFDQIGKLNQYGKELLWKEIDYYFKKFDWKEINLKPSEDRHVLSKIQKYQLPPINTKQH